MAESSLLLIHIYSSRLNLLRQWFQFMPLSSWKDRPSERIPGKISSSEFNPQEVLSSTLVRK